MRISSERALPTYETPIESPRPAQADRRETGKLPKRPSDPAPAFEKFQQSKRQLRAENREEGGRRRRDQEDNGQDSSRPAVLHSSPSELLRPAADDVVEADDHNREGELGVHPVVY